MRTALYLIALSLYDLAHAKDEQKPDVGNIMILFLIMFFIMDIIALSKGI